MEYPSSFKQPCLTVPFSDFQLQGGPRRHVAFADSVEIVGSESPLAQAGMTVGDRRVIPGSC